MVFPFLHTGFSLCEKGGMPLFKQKQLKDFWFRKNKFNNQWPIIGQNANAIKKNLPPHLTIALMHCTQPRPQAQSLRTTWK
jgi:hypothetical protein